LGILASLVADEAYADGPAEREEHHPIPPKPEWPEEHECSLCGELVYRVEAPDRGGDAADVYVELDIDELAVIPGNQLLGEAVARRDFRHPFVRTIGGHQLLDPELFTGFDDEPPTWKWFTRRLTLEQAHQANDIPLHAEHFTTCAALSAQSVAGKINGAAGRPRRMRTIRLQSDAEPEQESQPEPALELAAEPEESVLPPAMDRHQTDSEDDQLTLF
jgi:hypothetical protein